MLVYVYSTAGSGLHRHAASYDIQPSASDVGQDQKQPVKQLAPHRPSVGFVHSTPNERSSPLGLGDGDGDGDGVGEGVGLGDRSVAQSAAPDPC
jgi:hypothetical protein